MSPAFRTGRALLLAAALAVPAAAHAQPLVGDSAAIHALIRERVDQRRSVGMVAGWLGRDGVPHVVAYGDPGPGGPALLDSATVFEIGSITKVFTTTVLADMVIRGEVRLDDPVAALLPPGVRVPSRGGREITLLDLATHTSGLPRLPGNLRPADGANPYADYTVERLYEFLASYELPRDIGAQYEYSNVGMGLLGHALARKAGRSFEELVVERIARPLGMHDTRIELDEGMRARLARGHNAAGRPAANWDIPTLAGSGALRSTVADMLRFVAAARDTTAGPLNAAMALAQRTRRPTGGPLTVALGWHIAAPFGAEIFWHNGGTGGYHSFLGFERGTGASVVILANSTHNIDDIGMHVIDRRLPLSQPAVERAEVTLDPATLDRYVGLYELTPDFAITITREGAQLHLQATGQQKFPLFAASETRFFLRVVDAQITFTMDAGGTVTGLVLHQNGGNVPGRKVR